MRGRTSHDGSLHSHLAVWRSHFLIALLARESDQPTCARSNRKSEEEESLLLASHWKVPKPLWAFPYPSKEQDYTLWEHHPTLIVVRGPREKGLRGYASQSPRLYHPYNGLS